MKKLVAKSAGYIFVRYIAFYFALFIEDKNVKSVKTDDLKNGEDWFMFFWLFLVPPVIEVIILSLPFAFGINILRNTQNRFPFYLLFLELFLREFIISDWVIGIRHPFLKVSLSLLLFLLFFRRYLFNKE